MGDDVMSKFIKVQQGIIGLGPGEYQRLCSDYIIKIKKYDNMHDFGSKEGSNKTTKGTPDSYSVDNDGKYSLIMCGTVEKNSIQKIQKDINDAHSVKKTGIPIEKVKEIICFHTCTNISPGQNEELKSMYNDVKIELIDIDTMSHDICENYPSLASDYLQVSIDTDQITDSNEFIKRYDKYSVNAPLSLSYIERKEKQEIIEKLSESKKLLLITGKPGVGKTKIAIEICKELEKNKDITCLCVRLNGEDLYEDIKTALEVGKKYIVFVDDINNLRQIQSFIDCIITNKNENIKVIATVRDYLLKDTQDKVKEYIVPDVYNLSVMEDNDIINILEQSYNVKNKSWQKQIVKISNGNPRIAIMATQAALDGKIKSLNSVADVFKNYYDKILEQNKLNEKQIKILFYISLFSPFSINNEDIVKSLEELEIYDIDEYELLRDLEFIEFYNDEAIKICDQNFANYIVYFYLIEKKNIKISDLLLKLYPKFISKFISAINMINSYFLDEDTINYISKEINIVWNKEEYKNDRTFLKLFHNVDIPKTLSMIKKRVDSIEKIDIPSEIKYDRNTYLNDEIIEILSDLRNTDSFEIAFMLLLNYLEKRPDLYNEVCKAIIDYWLMKKIDLDFNVEKIVIEVLYKKYSSEDKMKNIYKILLENALKECLKTEFQIHEQGKNFRTLNLIMYTVQPSDKVIEFRHFCFDIIIDLSIKDESTLELLTDYSIWPLNEIQKELIKDDFEYLKEKLFDNWSIPTLQGCIVLSFIEKMCNHEKISIPDFVGKYKNNKKFLLLKDVTNNKKELIENTIKTLKIEDYNNLFELLKSIKDDSIKVDEWAIQSSLAIIFRLLVENDFDLFKKVFSIYLDYDSPFMYYPDYLIINNEYFDELVNLIFSHKTNNKYYYLKFLMEKKIDKDNLPIVEDFLIGQCTNSRKYSIDIHSIIEYSIYSPMLLEKYTRQAIDFHDFNFMIGYLSSVNSEEEAIHIYESFAKKDLLEELYIAASAGLSDHLGWLGFLLVKNNNDFLRTILKNTHSHRTERIHNIIEKIWQDKNAKNIITNIYNDIYDSQFGYLDLHYLFVESNKEIRNIQKEWFKDYVLINLKDIEKIYHLFNVISEKDIETRLEMIIYLISQSSDIEVLKKINIFPSSESWVNSRIPLIERKIDFVNNLINKIEEKKDIDYIEHIEYLHQIIENLEDAIKNTKTKEYIDDFYN